MQVRIKIDGDVDAYLREELQRGERAVKRAMASAASDLKTAWRQQIRASGLGVRLANSVRSEAYPKGGDSLNAAGMVWTKAPKLIDAHNRGVLIRSNQGLWLAIPTAEAGPAKARFGRRITPTVWEQRTGRKLRFVYRRGRSALLVADDFRISKVSGIAKTKGGRRRSDGILTGAQTVVIFTLVRQAKLPKRLDLDREADGIANTLPARILANWEAK